MSGMLEEILNAIKQHIKAGDRQISGTDFLGSDIDSRSREIMDSWEDPRGPGYSKATIKVRLADEAKKGLWYRNKATVLSLCVFTFVIGLMFGFVLL